MPASWTFAGSNDGVTWTVLDVRSGIYGWSSTVLSQTFTLSAVANYSRYRPNVTSTANGGYITLGELALIGAGTTYATNVSSYAAALVSFDGRATWKSWSGAAWVTASLSSIGSSGAPLAMLVGALDGYVLQTGETGVDFAFALSTADSSAAPAISSVMLTRAP